MPPLDTFRDAESYYGTLAHETTHWTRHPKRLDRDFGRKKFGDEGYAREELVAELGSAYLCADLNLAPVVKPENVAYIASWLTALKDDKREIFRAAAHAQRAVDYLHSLQGEGMDAQPEEEPEDVPQPEEPRPEKPKAKRPDAQSGAQLGLF